MKRNFILFMLTGLIALLVLGCDGSSSNDSTGTSGNYNPSIEPADFTTEIDNIYLPLTPGTTLVYEGETEDGELETITYSVTDETREVMGVTCVVVRDTVTIDGELVEDTYDWFAQDSQGNVWYFGEDSSEYEDGEFIGNAGSWEAGVDGAKPGIVMYVDPGSHIGEEYRQEYYAGEAEDMGKVVEVGITVLADGKAFTNCVKTEDYTPLEPGVLEYKYYAPGIGLILEEKPDTGEIVELMRINFDSESMTFDAGIYYPLTVGDIYRFQETAPDEDEPVIIKRVVDSPVTVDGIPEPVLPLTEIDEEGEIDEIAYFARDSVRGFLNYGEDEVGGDCQERLSPAFVIPHGLAVGQTVAQSVDFTITGDGEACSDVATADYTISFGGVEAVTVPFGTFDECAKITIAETWTDTAGTVVKESTKTVLLAPGIGEIKEIDTDDEGTEVAELVSVSNPMTSTYNPSIDPTNFTTSIDNTYMPLTPGTTLIYEGETEEGEVEIITYAVTDQTRTVMGVPCVVVRDTVTIEGELVEDTYDWFAQDSQGNVWYFGEDSSEYGDGEFVGNAGSWEAGVDGAKPGIVMYADPASHIGEAYLQEYYAGEAEDMGKVVEAGLTITVAGLTFTNCIKTEDWTPLEPGVLEYKYYAPGVGHIREEKPDTGEMVELVEITTE